MRVFEARNRVEAAALNVILARDYAREEDPNADAAEEYADDELALAARDLVRAVEKLPADEQPVGWDKESDNG